LNNLYPLHLYCLSFYLFRGERKSFSSPPPPPLHPIGNFVDKQRERLRGPGHYYPRGNIMNRSPQTRGHGVPDKVKEGAAAGCRGKKNTSEEGRFWLRLQQGGARAGCKENHRHRDAPLSFLVQKKAASKNPSSVAARERERERERERVGEERTLKKETSLA